MAVMIPALCLALALLLSAAPAPASAVTYYYTVIDETAKTAQLNWIDGASGAVTIPGVINGYTITRLGNNINNSILVPSGGTQNTTVESVTIPGSVTSIGSKSFYKCKALTTVNIPDSVTSIESWAFEYCTALKSVTIPGTTTSIGAWVFDGCTGLTGVSIGSGVTSISNGMFYNCPGLTDVTIPGSVTSIGDHAFSQCTGLTSVTIPSSVTSLGYQSFNNCTSLTSVSIGSGITSISEGAFGYCTALTDVTIPDGVTSIGNSAFYNCTGLTTVLIGNGVTSIGNWAFYGCAKLTTIEFPETESVTSIGSGAFGHCTSLTLADIPGSVTSIGDEAFSGCSRLTKVTFESGVTSIGNWAFYDCTRLTSITIPDSVTSIGEGAFSWCTGLTRVLLESGVTSIGSRAFKYCDSLYSAYFHGNAPEYFGDSVFDGAAPDFTIYYRDGKSGWTCPEWNGYTTLALVSMTITTPPDKLNYTVGDALDLTGLVVTGTYCDGSTSELEVKEDNVTGFDSSAPAATQTLTVTDGWKAVTFVISIEEGTTTSGNYTYRVLDETVKTAQLNRIDEASGAVAIPDAVDGYSITKLGNIINGSIFVALSDASNDTVTSVTIPGSVTSIGDYAFNGCTGLTSVSIPQGVTGIGKAAFEGCTGLTQIRFNTATITIYDGAGTIPDQARIIGCDPSTAKDYAAKYSRTFEVITPITQPEVTVNETNKNLAITAETPDAVKIAVPGSITDATVNIGELLSDPFEGTVTSYALPALNIETSTIISEKPVQLAMPQGLTVSASADDNWDGTINLPTIKAGDSVSPEPGAEVSAVIEIGFGDVPLEFSKAVRILLPGQAGKKAGYYRGATFTEITTLLAADTQAAGDALPAGGDGKIDVGTDLVIWTKHFTSFVTYTKAITGSTGISGSFTFQVAPESTDILQAEVSLWTAGADRTTATPVLTQQVDIAAKASDNNGSFQLTGLQPGSYDITLKLPYSLRALKSSITITQDATTPVDFGEIILGDTWGEEGPDNVVDVSDYSAILYSFGTVPGDENYIDTCDLNRDGVVDVSDYSIVLYNFSKYGAAPF
jgi:hypothetical protein